MKIIKSNEAISFTVKVQPRSSINKIVGIEGDALKIKLTAPPIEGKANYALINFLSDILSLKKSDIRISKGQKSKLKKVKISGISEEELIKKLSI